MLFFTQGFLFFCHTAVHCCSTKPSASIIFDSMVSTSAAEALPPPSVWSKKLKLAEFLLLKAFYSGLGMAGKYY